SGARELHRSLDRLGPAGGEQRDLERRGHSRREGFGTPRRLDGGTRVYELRCLAAERLSHAQREARVIVAEIEHAEAGEEVEIAPLGVVPQPDVARAHEHATIPEQAEELDERRIDVPGVSGDDRIGLGQHRAVTPSKPRRRRPRSIAAKTAAETISAAAITASVVTGPAPARSTLKAGVTSSRAGATA